MQTEIVDGGDSSDSQARKMSPPTTPRKRTRGNGPFFVSLPREVDQTPFVLQVMAKMKPHLELKLAENLRRAAGASSSRHAKARKNHMRQRTSRFGSRDADSKSRKSVSRGYESFLQPSPDPSASPILDDTPQNKPTSEFLDQDPSQFVGDDPFPFLPQPEYELSFDCSVDVPSQYESSLFNF